MDINKLCLCCMREKHAQGMPCPFCGFDEAASPNPAGTLPLWTVLNGSYLVGKKLGDGGFGISYTAFDMNLQKKVAIKEYFPYGVAKRTEKGTDVFCADASRREMFDREKERFVREAQILASLTEQRGVVNVNYYFRENASAYIVMEFVEGVSLLRYTEDRGGRLAPQEALSLLKGVIATLAQIHEKGVVHEDISPDNIIITPGGGAKLIDFGAAHMKGAQDDRTLVYKEHFSPPEQMEGSENVGAWTDIYALCATLYFALTGEKPVSAAHRKRGVALPPPSEKGVGTDALTESALLYGMELAPEERIRDAADLYYFFYQYGKEQGASPQRMKAKIKSSMPQVLMEKLAAQKRRERRRNYILFGGLAVLMFGLALLIANEVLRRQDGGTKEPSPVQQVQTTYGTEKTGDAETLAVYRDALYARIAPAREETLERTAAECNRAVTVQNHATEEAWTGALKDAMRDAMRANKTEDAGWVVLPVHGSFDAEAVLREIEAQIAMNNRGVENALTLDNAPSAGIDVGAHADGTIFISLLFR